MSTPSWPHGSFDGSRSAQTLMRSPSDDEMIAVDADRQRERPVRRVVARQMRVGLGVAEVVDGDDLNLVGALALVERAQNVAADTAVTVDCNFDGHGCLLRPDENDNSYKEDYSKRLAAATTASTVKPKCSNSGFAGAEWPKRSIPMTSPRAPT